MYPGLSVLAVNCPTDPTGQLDPSRSIEAKVAKGPCYLCMFNKVLWLRLMRRDCFLVLRCFITKPQFSAN